MENSWLFSKNYKTNEYQYNRIGHPKEKKVKQLISNNFGIDAKQVSLTSSGIESISFTLQTIMIENQFKQMNIIYSNELYCDTPRYINYFNDIYGVSQSYKFDVSDLQQLESDFKGKYNNQINILFFETCSNPSGKILDFSIIPELRKQSSKLYVVVDNTWLSSVCFNPLQYGADIVVTSMTKYYSCGSCLGGFVVGPSSFSANLNNFIRIGGHHISVPYCEKFLQYIPTMEERIKVSSAITLEIVKFLASHPKVLEVNYSLLESNTNYKLACTYFKYGPSVVSFKIKMNIKDAKIWMSKFKSIIYKTSFGSKETKFDTWPKKISPDITQCRLAIGTESNSSVVIKELDQKLKLIA
jgi:cystathionine beta-lyase/cystathionine gamma-synthase